VRSVISVFLIFFLIFPAALQADWFLEYQYMEGSYNTLFGDGNREVVKGMRIEQLSVAVLDFQAKGVSEAEALMASGLLRQNFGESDSFKVMKRDDMDDLLGEKGLSGRDCVSEQCLSRLTEVLKVHRIITGTLTKGKGGVSVTIIEYDAQNKNILATVTESVSDPSSSSEMAAISNRLMLKIEKKVFLSRKAEQVKLPQPYGWSALGTGLFAAAALGLGIYFNQEIVSIQGDYDSLAKKYKSSTDINEATALHRKMDSLKGDSEDQELYRNICFGVSGGLMAVALGLMIKFAVDKSRENKFNNSIALYDDHESLEPLAFSGLRYAGDPMASSEYYFGGGVRYTFDFNSLSGGSK